MTDDHDPWGHELDAAWGTFRDDLEQRLTSLEAGDELSLGTPDDEVPYVRFSVLAGKGVSGEVLGNDGTGHRRLDSREVVQLSRLGWYRLGDESDPAVTHWRIADATSYAVTAVMTERTLREVFGVLHPAFLDDGGSRRVVEVAVPQQTGAHPDCRDELVGLVEDALGPLLGDAATRDPHGNLTIVTCSTVVHVEVGPDPVAVDVYAVLARDVAESARALGEVNILNRESRGPTYWLREDRILARQRVSARPFVAAQLQAALAVAIEDFDDLATDLVARVGGRRWLSEPGDRECALPAVNEETSNPGRVSLRTLMHLEADQPGSVDAHLAAHIFDYDRSAILGQISRLRRDGRVTLVPLLRQALRVVVEDGHARSAN